jgi:hypothetical protein
VEFEVFFDGDCLLCTEEVSMLKKKSLKANLVFTDVTSADFDASELGLTKEILMARMHGRGQLYGAIGFGGIASVSRLPEISAILSLGYSIAARKRTRLNRSAKDGAHGVPVLQGGYE